MAILVVGLADNQSSELQMLVHVLPGQVENGVYIRRSGHPNPLLIFLGMVYGWIEMGIL